LRKFDMVNKAQLRREDVCCCDLCDLRSKTTALCSEREIEGRLKIAIASAGKQPEQNREMGSQQVKRD
jgi:hypothetical protein